MHVLFLPYYSIGCRIIGDAVGFNEPHEYPVIKSMADGAEPQRAAELIQQPEKQPQYKYFNQHNWFFVIGDVCQGEQNNSWENAKSILNGAAE